MTFGISAFSATQCKLRVLFNKGGILHRFVYLHTFSTGEEAAKSNIYTLLWNRADATFKIQIGAFNVADVTANKFTKWNSTIDIFDRTFSKEEISQVVIEEKTPIEVEEVRKPDYSPLLKPVGAY